jgi:hypothetical protein
MLGSLPFFEPNNGVFKVLVGLEKAAIINIRIIDMISHEVIPTKLTPSTYFTIPFNTSASWRILPDHTRNR